MQKSVRKSFFIIFGSLLLLTMLNSCNQHVLMDENMAIYKEGWNLNQKADFEVNVEDTLGLYAFYINIRQQETYRFSNLYIFLHTTFPNGTLTHDTIECVLAHDDGRWLGKSSGSLISNQILLNPSLRFPLAGNYRFEIEQAMRESLLQGIEDIGIRIEKQN